MTALDSPVAPSGMDPGRHGGTRWGVVAQLARSEARRLMWHPLVWLGILLGALLLVAILGPARFVLPRESILVQFAAQPIAAGTLIAAHLATTRPRRDDATELLAPAQHGEDTRTLALLLAVLGPTALTAALVAGLLTTLVFLGAVGTPDLLEALTAPALVAAAGVLGVLVGRLAPWRAAPLFAVAGMAGLQVVLSARVDADMSLKGRLAPVAMPPTFTPDVSVLLRSPAMHLLYLLGIAAVLAAVAMLASRRTPRRLAALTVALAVTVAAGVVQLRPPDETTVDALLARVVDPVAAGECTSDATGATVCAMPPYTAWRDGWVEVVEGVRAPLVERGLDPGALVVAQAGSAFTAGDVLAPWFADGTDRADIEARLEAAMDAALDLTDDQVRLTQWQGGMSRIGADRLALGLQVAMHAIDLPPGFEFVQLEVTGDHEGARSCTAVGQAREPIALWLAAQADPAAARALRQAAVESPYPGTTADPLDDGSIDDVVLTVNLSGSGVVGMQPQWSKPGVAVALQFLELPTDEVLGRLAADWDRWTGATTPLRDLVDELGLTMPPLADQMQAELGEAAPVDDLRRFFRDTPLPAPALDASGVATYDIGEDVPIGCP